MSETPDHILGERGSGPRADDPCHNCGTYKAADFITFDTPYNPDDDHGMKLCLACCDMMTALVYDYFVDNPLAIENEEKRTGRPLRHFRQMLKMSE